MKATLLKPQIKSLLIGWCLLLNACNLSLDVPKDTQKDNTVDSAQTETPARSEGIPGGDSDAHGCKPSTGYSWCAKENSCVQPWILAKEKDFSNDLASFQAYCK